MVHLLIHHLSLAGGRAGWVCRGAYFDKDYARSYIGWVWQEQNNGAIEFYYVTKDDKVVTLKQWAKGEPVYEKIDNAFVRMDIGVPP